MGLAGPNYEACERLGNRHKYYCFDAVHVPPQPFDCRKLPEPLRLET